MNKLIFLDIDGVLNSSSAKGPYISDMEIDKLFLLKKIIDETHSLGVVIISDRRYSEIDMKHKREAFDQYGIDMLGEIRKPIMGVGDNRGKQILDFLSSLKEEIDKIVIFDDNDDGISSLFPDEFIQITRFYGLNENVCQKALAILGDDL